MFCNSKKIPEWAENMDIIKCEVYAQKKSNIHLKTFGILKAIDNLNLSCIFNVTNDEYSNRGESAIWSTPGSVDR